MADMTRAMGATLMGGEKKLLGKIKIFIYVF